MKTFIKLTSKVGIILLLLLLPLTAIAGNRYDLPRLYLSEISVAKAFLLTSYDRGNVDQDVSANGVIIDVRTVEEYKAGHPKFAINIPYPRIHARPGDPNYIAQDPVQFVDDVVAAFPDKETPIFTLCRTGYRSVLAANLLAEAGYTHVRNIWQGFVGRTKVSVNNTVLDLNNDGVIDGSDADGWIGYQELPFSTKLLPQLIYARYAYLYYE